MTAPFRAEIAPSRPHQNHSMTEDYVGLAWYLAQAIARGDANFDGASAELHATATPSEEASLHHAADAAREQKKGALVARLLRPGRAH